MLITKDQIIEAISSMSVTDITDLIKEMEKKFGVSSISTSKPMSAIETSEPIEKSETKTEFNVVLKKIGNNKIAVIKNVRSAIGLGLKESKDLVESAPVTLKEGVSKNDAESFKKLLEESGAEIEIQ